MRYKIADIKRIRKAYSDLIESRKGQSTLICLNHVSRIDSMVFGCAMVPFFRIFTHYALYPWHVLDLANLPLLCPILKTVPIERMGDRRKIRLMQEKVKYLLESGDLVAIFPEGKRSLEARVDREEFQYGVGDILRLVPEACVLCVYLMADSQKGRSHVPPFGSTIHISFELIHPKTDLEGLRASRDLAGQIIEQLIKMEEVYLKSER
jgi:1-acyl-sn-glycerol-3-phosphate acyltransferase